MIQYAIEQSLARFARDVTGSGWRASNCNHEPVELRQKHVGQRLNIAAQAWRGFCQAWRGFC